MELLLYFLFFALISSVILLPLGSVAHNCIYPDDIPTRWANMLYYFIAAYPPLSFALLALAGKYLLKDSVADTIPEMQGILLFCSVHFVLCIFSVAAALYLRKLYRANVIFIVTSILSAAAYAYAGIFAFTEIIKK